MEGNVQEPGTITGSWLLKHQQIYCKATLHPFILSIRDGTLDFSSFKRWLGQDYLFVRAFVPFLASVLVKACKESCDSSDFDVLLDGLAALHDEISWFKKEASKWGILLSDITPQKPNQDYCRFIDGLMHPEVKYAVAVTALWAIEMVYQVSFALCIEDASKTPPELLETCQRWGSDGFKQYCCSLRKIVDRCLGEAQKDVVREAEETFLNVLDKEDGFWNMSCGDLP